METKKSLYLQTVKTMSKILTCLTVFVLICTSCSERNPQSEYENLCEKVYPTPHDGVVAAQDYIDYFHDNKDARITEVSEIRDQYNKMDKFFDKNNFFNSYSELLKKSGELNNELLHSSYSGVRQTWTSLYDRERNRLLSQLLDSITISDFDDFFKAKVQELSENEFNNWIIESINQISLSEPMLVNDSTAKKSQGVYRVHLRGRHVKGIKKDARISIEGIIGPDESGNVRPIMTGHNFEKKPII